MLTVYGSARNIMGLVVDGIDDPVPTVEVVLIGAKPFYGHTNEGKLAKGSETDTVRFSTSPKVLRHLAAKFMEYADQAEHIFGEEPESVPDEAENKPEPLPDAAGTPIKPSPNL